MPEPLNRYMMGVLRGFVWFWVGPLFFLHNLCHLYAGFYVGGELRVVEGGYILVFPDGLSSGEIGFVSMAPLFLFVVLGFNGVIYLSSGLVWGTVVGFVSIYFSFGGLMSLRDYRLGTGDGLDGDEGYPLTFK